MTSHVKILVALAVCAGAVFSHQARASYIEDWTFPASGTATEPINATSSSGTTGTPTLGGTLFSGGATADYTTSGGANMLSFTYPGFNPGDINNHTLTLTLTASTAMTLTGLTYLTSYNQTLFTVPVTQTWTYAITGGGSGTIGAVTLNNGNVTGESLDPGMKLTAGQTITLTDTFSGAFGINGTLDFGNISITAVPEPMTWALIGFGVTLVACAALRRIRPAHPLNSAG